MNENSPTEDPASSLVSQERAAITSSAKTHIRILRGEFLYLHATGQIPLELSSLVPNLLSSIHNSPLTANPLGSSYEILPRPLQIPISAAYTGSSNQHIVALAGDPLIMFARLESRGEAIAFNSRNLTCGLVPLKFLNLGEGATPFTGSRLCVAKVRGGGGNEWDFAAVKWEAGTHLRIWACKEDFGLIEGFGFNLATSQTGRFFAKAKDVMFIEEGLVEKTVF